MKNRSILRTWALILIGFNLSSLGHVIGSTCPGKPTVAQALNDSKVVFAGKVISKFKYGVKFKVDRAWKGVLGRYVYIYTSNLRNDVEPWFEKGEHWLVYASDVPLYRIENSAIPYTTRLMTPPCSRTVLLSNAKEDLNQLGEGKPISRAAIGQKRQLLFRFLIMSASPP
jgi:hypothetical protein